MLSPNRFLLSNMIPSVGTAFKPGLHILIGVVVSFALLWALYTLFMPVSGCFIRYLVWTTTPAGVALKGRVKTGDATIHFVSYGKGPAILLLHGGLSNRLIWFSQIPWLVATGHRVVLPDTRGHGESGIGNRPLNYRLLASDAIHVLDTLDIPLADVIGWSDGGNTALRMGQYWTGRIGRIVTVSANFSPSGLTPGALEETHTQSWGVSYWFKSWWTGAGKRLTGLERRIKQMWQKFPVLESVELENITNPTLVMVGTHDLISIAHAEKMASLLAHGTLKIIPGGHSIPVTHSKELNEAIAEFLGIPCPDLKVFDLWG
ncbi:hypothetical protein HRM2_08980 [Desulforapulum autotrophicum HRM2]|uniref:AB hydrolase-1 domain-containing protein n=2 Tax=Desulforapulum autotrophicum TaxID=2296 RepID=C0QKE0_DESAH|nr:hypothetical protein HRM2_08980 [Desulforapulum autotrophicum HRM2]